MNRPRHHSSAFTLVEVMLAVTLLGLLVMALTSTWNAGLRAWKHSNGLAENFQRQRVLLDALTEMSQAAVYAVDNPSLYALRNEHDPVRGDSISFVTASDALLPPGESILAGMRRVTIGMDHGANGQPCLTMQNTPALQETDRTAARPGHVIGRDVTSFALRFHHPDADLWKDQWASADGFPSAIQFTLTFAPLDERAKPLTVTRVVDFPAAKFANSYSRQTTK